MSVQLMLPLLLSTASSSLRTRSPRNADGCTAPLGAKWDRWDMAGSTYNYCYKGCHLPWFMANKARFNLSAYAGVVGVDHYWTGQGVPCAVDGMPQEFDLQDALATKWKTAFPGGLRYLSYRIPSAVGYDRVVQQKMVSNPDYFVRWTTEPDAATKQAQHCPASGAGCHRGDICVNHYVCLILITRVTVLIALLLLILPSAACSPSSHLASTARCGSMRQHTTAL